MEAAEHRERLREYYGRVLSKSSDLKTQCCVGDDTRRLHGEIIRRIPPEVVDRNYGCGCSIPDDDLSGLSVLDLGSGAGLDAFILSWLVGPAGHVIGVDMTAEQLAIARRNTPIVMDSFGFSRPNVEFIDGFIETVEGVQDHSVDLVVSDCVINLSMDKRRVFETIRRVLRPGGELYIADIVADRRVPEEIRRDSELVAECLGGALYEHDLKDLLDETGFRDPRIVSRRIVEEDVADVPIRFSSITFRAFALDPTLDRRCEDYGQTAKYEGSLPGQRARFRLDDHHEFEAGRPIAVCRNTARMLSETRLAPHFDVSEELRHFGLFTCGARDSGSGDGQVSCC
jgi:arsenite methyltransferase